MANYTHTEMKQNSDSKWSCFVLRDGDVVMAFGDFDTKAKLELAVKRYIDNAKWREAQNEAEIDYFGPEDEFGHGIYSEEQEARAAEMAKEDAEAQAAADAEAQAAADATGASLVAVDDDDALRDSGCEYITCNVGMAGDVHMTSGWAKNGNYLRQIDRWYLVPCDDHDADEAAPRPSGSAPTEYRRPRPDLSGYWYEWAIIEGGKCTLSGTRAMMDVATWAGDDPEGNAQVGKSIADLEAERFAPPEKWRGWASRWVIEING